MIAVVVGGEGEGLGQVCVRCCLSGLWRNYNLIGTSLLVAGGGGGCAGVCSTD